MPSLAAPISPRRRALPFLFIAGRFSGALCRSYSSRAVSAARFAALSAARFAVLSAAACFFNFTSNRRPCPVQDSRKNIVFPLVEAASFGKIYQTWHKSNIFISEYQNPLQRMLHTCNTGTLSLKNSVFQLQYITLITSYVSILLFPPKFL